MQPSSVCHMHGLWPIGIAPSLMLPECGMPSHLTWWQRVQKKTIYAHGQSPSINTHHYSSSSVLVHHSKLNIVVPARACGNKLKVVIIMLICIWMMYQNGRRRRIWSLCFQRHHCHNGTLTCYRLPAASLPQRHTEMLSSSSGIIATTAHWHVIVFQRHHCHNGTLKCYRLPAASLPQRHTDMLSSSSGIIATTAHWHVIVFQRHHCHNGTLTCYRLPAASLPQRHTDMLSSAVFLVEQWSPALLLVHF